MLFIWHDIGAIHAVLCNLVKSVNLQTVKNIFEEN